MRKTIIMAIVAISAYGLCSCHKSSNADTEQPAVTIHRLDRVIVVGDTAAAREMRGGVEAFGTSTGIKPDSVISYWHKSPAVAAFSPAVEQRLPSLASTEAALGSLRAHFAEELPQLRFPEIYSVVTPYRQSIMLVDTVMLVGLNHYLGEDFEGYQSFESYLRRYKAIERLPVDVAEALVSVNYPVTDANTLVARMLYAGAVAEAMHRVLPEMSEAEVLGYSADEWNTLNAREAEGWRKLVGEKWLFSTDPMVATRLLAPSPATPMLYDGAPGRAGRYYGYKIVNEYIKRHPDKSSLDRLLSPEFYASDEALIESGYSPTR